VGAYPPHEPDAPSDHEQGERDNERLHAAERGVVALLDKSLAVPRLPYVQAVPYVLPVVTGQVSLDYRE